MDSHRSCPHCYRHRTGDGHNVRDYLVQAGASLSAICWGLGGSMNPPHLSPRNVNRFPCATEAVHPQSDRVRHGVGHTPLADTGRLQHS